MKKIVVRLIKGNSTVFASIETHDSNGMITESERNAVGYYVQGAAGSMSEYGLCDKHLAFASFYAKIGTKVADGYVAERVESDNA